MGSKIPVAEPQVLVRLLPALRSLFRAFFERASPEQRHGLLQRLQDLHAAASNSEWFARHEIIGSSLLVGYGHAEARPLLS